MPHLYSPQVFGSLQSWWIPKRSRANAIKLVLGVMAFGVTIIEEVVVVVLYPPYSEQSREKSLVVNSCYVPYA